MPDLAIDLSRVALKRRRTKIVATVGPASSTADALVGLIEAGVDVFRLNFSHGTHESHQQAFTAIRAASARANKQVAVLGDLCGPKIRVGTFEGGGIDLEWGTEVVVTVREVEGKPGLIPSEYRALVGDVVPGDRILLDDGKLQLQVKQVQGETEIRCEVEAGGRLTNKKGMNLPGVRVSTPALTEKDKADAAFAVKLGVDYLALSFVRAPTDVADLKALLRDLQAETPVIAKIEKPEALDTIGGILEVADAIMVARGDLGVEMAAEEVPLIQQELVRLAVAAHKPVIVATQMLESMIESARPTRAEVTDVAAAALSRADAVMLSAETASGKHPREAVATMDRVLRMVEGYQWKRGQHGKVAESPLQGNVQARLNAALSRATSMLSGELEVRAVVAPTRTGRMARLISSARPAAPVLALTSSETLCRRMQLLWGVAPEMASTVELEAPAPLARAAVQRLGLASAGQHILLVWDASPDRSGLAPTVSILSV
ncbi:MAG TPA: pyruvate kinase [Myxococcales bacterium]|nr:pyruvate kinase [Myxococcales bacterium]